MWFLLQHNRYSHVFRAVLPPRVTKMNVLILVLYKHTLADRRPLTDSRVTEQKAREAFVRWDCGERVRRAALRKAAPVVGSYQVGDIVSYCGEARAGEHGLQWSVVYRLIVFEKDKKQPR